MDYWLWLSLIPYIGSITANRLLDFFGEPKAIYEASEKDLFRVEGISRKQVQSILKNKSTESAQDVLRRCEKNGISILSIADKNYPEKAKKYSDAPVILYYKGQIRNIDLGSTIGIVGARRCTQEARKKAIDIAEYYTNQGVTVISGMAKGIDAYAHTACIKKGGYTIAFLGNSVDICYPKEHVRLMEGIIESGLVVSEYPPVTKPTKYSFPQRNRLISAWSDQLVVISPGKGSGALITAEYAQKYGKQVKII